MTTARIDVWVSPSAPGTAPEGLDSTGDPVMNLPWSQAGLPSISIPSGRGQNGLPLGLQLTAGYAEDEVLLKWAGQIEQVLRDDNP
jgi:Asp-tRNA(Asn)/Glu-tRNA(Gln) amidotransferase A subunit family amidase